MLLFLLFIVNDVLMSVSYSDVADVSQSQKFTMQSGLEVLRAVKPFSVEAGLLMHLARVFSAKVCWSM